jgi:Transglutaminase-like superfamily
MLMIAVLRSRGIAARFVSGYVHLADDDDEDVTDGNTHAWVQVYVPGPGWVDFDPFGGVVGNQNHIRVDGRAAPARGDPPARHVVRVGVGSSRYEGRGEGQGGGVGRRRARLRRREPRRFLMKIRASYGIFLRLFAADASRPPSPGK